MSEQSIREMFQKSRLKICSSWRFVSVAWKLLGHGGIALPDGSRTRRKEFPKEKSNPRVVQAQRQSAARGWCCWMEPAMGLCIHGSWEVTHSTTINTNLLQRAHSSKICICTALAQQAWDSASQRSQRIPQDGILGRNRRTHGAPALSQLWHQSREGTPARAQLQKFKMFASLRNEPLAQAGH